MSAKTSHINGVATRAEVITPSDTEEMEWDGQFWLLCHFTSGNASGGTIRVTPQDQSDAIPIPFAVGIPIPLAIKQLWVNGSDANVRVIGMGL